MKDLNFPFKPKNHFTAVKPFRYLTIFGVVLCFSSCASAPPMIQPQVNSLVVAERFDYALNLLEKNSNAYGKNNELLYYLDYGLLLHLAGEYEKSIKMFEEAKVKYDNLFTISLRKEGTTWLINDYFAPYRGEDFERVLINIFQALNFAMLGNHQAALVEARDVDSKLMLINSQYKPDQKNTYTEDAFARLLMGILYESNQSRSDINDAHIENLRAWEIYKNNYMTNYKIQTPAILKENLLTTAHFMGSDEFNRIKKVFGDSTFVSIDEKQKMGEVFLIFYKGLSPIKHQRSIPIPLPGGYITRLSFPGYDKRVYDVKIGELKAVNRNNVAFISQTEICQDIGAIAVENLQNRRARVIAKAALRSGAKVMVERSIEKNIEKNVNKETGAWFRYVSNLYNITSEQADLRSWQTLPAEIHVARLLLKPGEYKIYFNNSLINESSIKAKDKRFFIVRTTQ